MSDNRPCRNDEGWRMCRLRWWIADRFLGRRMFNRVSHRDGGYFIDGGKVDLEALRGEPQRMDIQIYDPEEDSPP